ncbi:MAG: 6-phosphogluconolactonase [Kiloniellales bacterium]
MLEQLTFADRNSQAAALARAVAADLRDALALRGRSSLAVPGGTTPGAFLKALSQERLDWSAVRVTLTDERCLPSSSPRSNQRLLGETLLQDEAAAARFLPLYGEDLDQAMLADRLERDLLPLDVCVVGMGADMHTASLFPKAEGLDEALAGAAPSLVRITAPGAPEPRISLSAGVLRQARKAYILIVGAAKQEALQRALESGPASAAPIRVVLRREAPTAVYYSDAR